MQQWKLLGESEEHPWAWLEGAACEARYLLTQIKHLLDLSVPQHWEEVQQLLDINLSSPFALVQHFSWSLLRLPSLALNRDLLSGAGGGSVEECRITHEGVEVEKNWTGVRVTLSNCNHVVKYRCDTECFHGSAPRLSSGSLQVV